MSEIKLKAGPRLSGRIHVYSDQVRSGLIEGDNNKTYLFTRKDWLSEKELAANIKVSFVEEANWARLIIDEEET